MISDGVMVLAVITGPVMVVMSPIPDVTVTVVVVAGGMMVVMKCEEHSSAPAGFQYMAFCCQYILISTVGIALCSLSPL